MFTSPIAGALAAVVALVLIAGMIFLLFRDQQITDQLAQLKKEVEEEKNPDEKSAAGPKPVVKATDSVLSDSPVAEVTEAAMANTQPLENLPEHEPLPELPVDIETAKKNPPKA